MVREPNARMCGWDSEPALRHPQMVYIPFTVNQTLSVFCANTKRTGFNRAPNTCRTQTAQRVSGALVYTRFKKPTKDENLESC